ncbi:MAG: efflux RND transporter periplasmic adaptor subunit [Candidatus Eremiobacteraeota bacterium]|nr:efflux RND transporter periplasmic adaptor subunit [Candidatus Eremiobacteraeota bacterium]
MRRSWILAPLLMAHLCGCNTNGPTAASPTAVAEEQHEHEHAEGVIELSGLQVKSAKIKVEDVSLRSFSGDFQASGSLTYDKDLQVRVTSPLTGKAIELRSRLGDVVTRGQVLAVIDCPELVKYKADYHEAETDFRLAQQSLERRRALARYGDITRRPLDDARKELATSQAELEVATVTCDVNKKNVERTQDLLTNGVASQAQLEQARADFDQAQAKRHLAEVQVRLARGHLQREEQIGKMGLLSNKEIQEAEANRERAEERAKHLKEGLEALQADPEGHGSLIQIRAPISGTVTSRPISLGESVTTEEELFTLVNAERLWLWVNVLESELSKLRRGQRVEVSVTAFPGRTFDGTIGYIAPELDEKTRAARAQVLIHNEDLRLKPAMVAQVRVVTSSQRSLVVAESALQKVQDLEVVYVVKKSQEDDWEFERRPVVVSARSGGWAQVSSGLKVGERIVSEGSSILKGEDLKGSLEEGGHHH